jgi:hypothetical protein
MMTDCSTRTQQLFEQDILVSSARTVIFYASSVLGTLTFGFLGLKLRSVREPLGLGCLLYLISTIGWATIEPGQNVNIMVFAGVGGFGFGAIPSQTVAGTQLAVPHSYLATATALAITSRAIGAAIWTAVYFAILNGNLANYLKEYVTAAANRAGLSGQTIPAYVAALTGANATAVLDVPGVTEASITLGELARHNAYADSVRYAFIAAAVFAFVATVICYWIEDVKKIMTYHVDAPVEDLMPKHDKTKEMSA